MVEEKSGSLDLSPGAESFKVPDAPSVIAKKSDVAAKAPQTPNLAAEPMMPETPPLTVGESARKLAKGTVFAGASVATPAATPSDTTLVAKLLTGFQNHKSSSTTQAQTPSMATPSKSKSGGSNAGHLLMTPSSAASNGTPVSRGKFDMVTPVRRVLGTNGRRRNINDGFAFISHSPTTFPSLQPEIDDVQLARRKRRRTSPTELQILEEEFARCVKPSKTLREDIARRVGMTEKAVQIWFQNRRQAVRRQEQLFSSSSNDGASSDTGGTPVTPATAIRSTSSIRPPSSGMAHKYPSEGVIQYRIDGYQHKPPVVVSMPPTVPTSSPFTEGILLNSHKLTSLGIYEVQDQDQDMRSQSMPVAKHAKFTIYSDDTDEETEQGFGSARFSMARPTLSSVRTGVALSTVAPAHKRQRLASRAAYETPKSSPVTLSSLRLSMSSNGKAQVVIERTRNGSKGCTLPLHKKAAVLPSASSSSSSSSPKQSASDAKRVATLLRTKLSKSVLKAKLMGPDKLSLRMSPTKKRKLGGAMPPGSPSKRKLMNGGARVPLSPRKSLSPNKNKRGELSPSKKAQLSPSKKFPPSPSKRVPLSPSKRVPLSPNKRVPSSPSKKITLSPSKIAFLSPRKGDLSPSKKRKVAAPHFSAAQFPALPKSRSFTSALLMRHQGPPASNTAAPRRRLSPTQGQTQSKSPVGSPRKQNASARDIPSSPPFRLPARPLSAASSSSSSSSAGGLPSPRKTRVSPLVMGPETSRVTKPHKFTQALAKAAALAAVATQTKSNRLARLGRVAGGNESEGDEEHHASGKSGKGRKKVRVENREAECINNLLSLRAGDWAA